MSVCLSLALFCSTRTEDIYIYEGIYGNNVLSFLEPLLVYMHRQAQCQARINIDVICEERSILYCCTLEPFDRRLTDKRVFHWCLSENGVVLYNLWDCIATVYVGQPRSNDVTHHVTCVCNCPRGHSASNTCCQMLVGWLGSEVKYSFKVSFFGLDGL